MSVLVLVTTEDGALTKESTEALTLARSLTEAGVLDLEAAVVGAADDAVVGEIGRFGAAVVHTIEHDLVAAYGPDAWAQSVEQLLRARGSHAVVAPGSERGNEVMAHVAARAGLPFAANTISVAPAAGGWELTRVRWGGMLLEEARLEASCGLFTAAQHHVAPVHAETPTTPATQAFVPDLDASATTTAVQDRAREAGGVSLATAPVVVAGGRGVGSAEGFGLLEELAELLGGAVGCSRVATNNGWRPHRDQVGQTGTRVAPELYIACGISGATQHWVGCMSSKRILAINTDTEAPMVTRADYAVIGDLHDLLPAVVEEVRRRKGPS